MKKKKKKKNKKNKKKKKKKKKFWKKKKKKKKREIIKYNIWNFKKSEQIEQRIFDIFQIEKTN